MPIGETLTGLPMPVFYDPHYAIRINRPPVTLITGSPGSGKTVASLLLASHSALLNKITFILDPKGDFLALQKLSDYGEIENVKVWSVFSDASEGIVADDNIGMLDPTRLTDSPYVNASLTMETITILTKDLSSAQRSTIIPIIQDVTESNNPSLRKVISVLARSRHEEISSLAHELNLSLSLPAGKLLVASSRHQDNKLDLTSGVVVASLMGLSLPPSTKKEESYQINERVSVAIIRLLTHLVLDIMKSVPKDINKTLFIDEAWAVFNNEAGRALIDEVALLGRSLNMATILSTQSPSHVQGAEGEASLDNTISTRMAFRNTSDSDNKINTEVMGLPKGVNFEGTFKNLGIGQCLMKDARDQFAFIKIDVPPLWLRIFDTKPKSQREEK